MFLTHLIIFNFLPGATLVTDSFGSGLGRDRIIKLRRQRAFRVW